MVKFLYLLYFAAFTWMCACCLVLIREHCSTEFVQHGMWNSDQLRMCCCKDFNALKCIFNWWIMDHFKMGKYNYVAPCSTIPHVAVQLICFFHTWIFAFPHRIFEAEKISAKFCLLSGKTNRHFRRTPWCWTNLCLFGGRGRGIAAERMESMFLRLRICQHAWMHEKVRVMEDVAGRLLRTWCTRLLDVYASVWQHD